MTNTMRTINCGITEVPARAVGLRWLGQAGFDISWGHHRLLIDPYLSDSLAKKYAGQEFDHQRMMPAPVGADQLRGVEFVVCTHRHSDHMDPEAIPIILRNNPDCLMVAPEAEKEHVLDKLGISAGRVLFTDAGRTSRLAGDIELIAINSAHEEIKTDDNNHSHYLGYILRLGRMKLYHSGDCVPYDGLGRALQKHDIDIAMLPVNGRDKFRKSRGVPGNSTFDEAAELCRQAAIPTLLCHHFGMFSFNTMDPDKLSQLAGSACSAELEQVIVPDVNKLYWAYRLDSTFQGTQQGL